MKLYRNRTEAGRKLAATLAGHGPFQDGLVLALPRGGVPVAHEISRSLGLELDVLLVRKLGVPDQPELAMGAIASGGHRVLNEDLIQGLGIPPGVVEQVARAEQVELARRERAYRGEQPPARIADRDVVVVDDGLATGASMRAAISALGRARPRRLIVAVPVGARQTCRELREQVDELVCLATPEPFMGVGLWYESFAQTTDEQVRALLRARRAPPAGGPELPHRA